MWNIPTANATVYVIDSVLMPDRVSVGRQDARITDVDHLRPVEPAASSPRTGGPDLVDLLRRCGLRRRGCLRPAVRRHRAPIHGLAVRVVRVPGPAGRSPRGLPPTSGAPPALTPTRGSPLSWLLTITHPQGRRPGPGRGRPPGDITYHQRSQPVEHDSTAGQPIPRSGATASAARWPT